MINRLILKCNNCKSNFYFRIEIGCSYNHKFRFNCPVCNFEIHGETTLNFQQPDGTLRPVEQSQPDIRINNCQRLGKEDSTILHTITVFTDIPINKRYYKMVNCGFPFGPGPAFQSMNELKSNALVVLNGVQRFYGVPQNEVFQIKNAYNSFRANDLENAKNILYDITSEVPKELSRIPSICAHCYQTLFYGLIGVWDALPKHNDLVTSVINKYRISTFDVPKKIQEFGYIDNLITEFFDLANQIYECKEILSVARYFDFVIENNPSDYEITLDYPDKFFNFYEQLCEYAHNIIKIQIGYINILNRGSVDSFPITSKGKPEFPSYKKFFDDAKLFKSLDLIMEYPELGKEYNDSIDRTIRNGIAHKKITFSMDGQTLEIRKKTNIEKISYENALRKAIKLCRICVFGFSIITDQKRMISDEIWNSNSHVWKN